MGKTRWSDLDPLEVSDIVTGDTLVVLDKSDTTMGSTGTQKEVDAKVALRPHKVYVALLTQSGTNDPTAAITINTTGLTWTWTRSSEGVYYIESSETLDKSKISFITSGFSSGKIGLMYVGGPGGQYATLEVYNITNGLLVDINASPGATIEINLFD